MSIAAFIRNEILLPRLRKASVLAVYDPDQRYHGICQSIVGNDTAVVDASETSIEAREAAMLALASLGKPDRPRSSCMIGPCLARESRTRPTLPFPRRRSVYAATSPSWAGRGAWPHIVRGCCISTAVPRSRRPSSL
jgi:hypothetical protein